jgi:acid phosphatase type 7
MKARRIAALIALASALVLGLGILAVPAAVPARADTTDPVVAAAGNIACDPNNANFHALVGTKNGCRMKYVSDLLLNPNATPKYETVLALGDTQYICGGLAAYNQSYGPTWGRVFQVTKPVVGDKDYRSTANAATGTGCSAPPGRAEGFFSYFASKSFIQKGTTVGSGAYYSFNVPTGCTPDGVDPCWHFIALNGNCKKAPGCTPGTKQYDWVAADLAAYPNSSYGCTAAFWHWPRFSSGAHGSDPKYDALWRLLYQNGVDVVLNAHEHVYERFAPQNPDGVADPAHGIRQFTVGTGGVSHAKFPSASRAANSQVSNDATFGILTMALHQDAYDWSFIPETGKTFTDASLTSAACH